MNMASDSAPTPVTDRDDVPLLPAGPPERRSNDAGRIVPALILIALGGVFLLGNVVPIGGATLFLGLGMAFLVARFVTQNYGLAVPAGILLGFGSFVALSEAGLLPGDDGGWFFILLGLGFLAVYVIGLRPSAVWPLFPAAVLTAFGAMLLGLVNLWPLAQFAWLASYWPLILIGVGLWLLVRDRLPLGIRRPLAVLGVFLLVLYGVVAVGGLVVANADPGSAAFGRVRFGVPPFGAPALTETVDLAAPIGADQTFRVNNPNGRTAIRAGGGAEVRVVATKRFWSPEQAPDVRLTPGAGGVTLEATTIGGFPFGNAARVDYVVEVPAGVTVEAHSASGDTEITGLTGAVQAESASGELVLTDLSGSVAARSASGDIRLTNLSGEARANAVSGEIQATNLALPREVTTVSGDITLAGVFADTTGIQSTSGDVDVRVAPSSSARVDVGTTSGDIETRGLALADQRQERRSLTGTLGAGAGTLTVRTVSGDVTLAAGQ
jgi:hypothetical protein